MNKILKKVNEFPFSWNNFQKFIKEIEKESEKIFNFLGKVFSII